MAVHYFACMALVASFYQLPPRVLPSIQMVEGGRIGLTHLNADGSADLGVMQVNTRWVMPLARHTGLSPGAVRRRLVNHPCFGIATAGAIMRIYLNEERGNLMRAIGDYHSHTLVRNMAYQLKVLSAAHVLFGQRS